ncbi:MAG: hypothetical protein ACLQMO_12020 [Acidobacteriaceae bacterium]
MERHSNASARARPNSPERLRDEVYRQMFRAEAGRPRAEVQLAVALLHAWMGLETLPPENEQRQWLRTVCPMCLAMIEERHSADEERTKRPGKNRRQVSDGE